MRISAHTVYSKNNRLGHEIARAILKIGKIARFAARYPMDAVDNNHRPKTVYPTMKAARNS